MPQPGWSSPKKSPTKKPVVPDELKDASRGRRLQRVMMDAGVGSRRACEALVEEGDVTVNGHVITELPVWVDLARDAVVVKGKRLRAPEKMVYVMLFKPRGVVCTNDDPEGRTRAIDLVKHPSRTRLYPVGRLDMDSSGLLLLTNDGELANRVTHPRYGVHKVYEVTIDGSLSEEDVAKLERGFFLSEKHTTHGRREGHRTGQSKLTLLKRDRDRTRLRMELREGRNRQIRRMMARVGYRVKKLRRIQMGPIKLRGLQPGQWRDLLPRELIALRKVAGMPKA
jgi:23S rRNA pseudouridine2605 synthase